MADIETMFDARPWAGLGNEVTHDMSVDEMVKAAGLDWKVQRRRLYMREAKGRDKLVEVPDFFAITRDTDAHVFQVASDRYHPVQNEQILEIFREVAEAGELKLETAGAFKHGAIVWALASVGESFTLAGKDEVRAYILLANSHDGSMTFNGRHTQVRVICWNTFQMALHGAKAEFAVRHTRLLKRADLKALKAALGLSRDRLHEYEDAANELAEVQVDAQGQEVMRYVAAVFDPELLEKVIDKTVAQDSGSLLDAVVAESVLKPKKLKEEDFNAAGKAVLHAIMNGAGSDLVSAKNTWWGAFNGVTEYIDHEAGRSRDTGLASAWFGQGRDRKETALELAIQAAEAMRN